MSRTRAVGWLARTGGAVALTWVALAFGLVAPSLVRAQGADPGKDPAGAPAEPRHVGDLTTRYRFVERYSATVNRESPAILTQYRVGIRETIKTMDDRPQGTPVRTENTFQTIFNERTAQVSEGGEVTAVVRAYEAFRRIPEPQGQPKIQRPLEGLTLWMQPTPGQEPLVLSLSERRGLRDLEYRVICQQVFLPSLSRLLPALPTRIGDRWRIPAVVIQALLGAKPLDRDPLSGTLLEMRQSDKSTNWVAVINVAGKLRLNSGDSSVNARILFEFLPPKPPAEGEAGAGAGGQGGASESPAEPGTLEATGAITEIRMAFSTTGALPGSDGRFRSTHIREMVLARQPGARTAALALPDPPPSPTEANSWLMFDDPQGRCHFRHPQRLLPDPNGPPGTSMVLVDQRPEGPDTVELDLLAKSGDPATDRQLNDPETFRKSLRAQWQQDRTDAILGTSGWLPEAQFGKNKKVYRIEAVIKPAAGAANRKGSQRFYADHYLVLFARNETLLVTSITVQDAPTAHRKEVEQIIKTFEIGPSPPIAAATPREASGEPSAR